MKKITLLFIALFFVSCSSSKAKVVKTNETSKKNVSEKQEEKVKDTVVKEYVLTEGDVYFQALPPGFLTLAIEGCSKSSYSHCGILIKEKNRAGKDEWFMLEAIGSVKKTPLKEWIKRGRKQKYDIYRFNKEFRAKIPEIITNCKTFLGKGYDYLYKLSDEHIYCSELIFKGFKLTYKKELGKIVKLGDLDWKPYKFIILKIDPSLPLERKMITPKNLAEAEQLSKVYTSMDSIKYLTMANVADILNEQ